MPGSQPSKALQQLLIKRADAAISYQKAKLQLAEINSQMVRQGVKDGVINIGDIGGSYW